MHEPPSLERTVDIFVVSHTHWDREWYRTAGEFRQVLVPLIDDLLDHPGTAPFLLDGQSILLDDYLAVRPERAAELRSAFRAGRLEAGPWFVLADELIPSGEALIRNLLAGRRAMRSLAAVPPPVLYSPDAFGHSGALPMLAAGFGARLVVVWRGYGGRRWPAGDTVRWRSPDGSEALLVHLPPDGYEFGAALPDARDPDAVSARWERIRQVLLARAGTGVSLLLNGADHHARQVQLDGAVEALAKAARPHRVHQASLSQLADALSARCANHELPRVAGELRDSYGYTWTLGGTLATRAAQKRQNAESERILVRDVEPWVAFLSRQSPGSIEALVDAAWRSLLACHPHDSLCGCSTDEVARAVDARLDSVHRQATFLRDRVVRRLLGHDADVAMERKGEWQPCVVLRNRTPRPRSGVAEVDVDVVRRNIPVGPRSAVELPDVAVPELLQLGGVAQTQPVARVLLHVREESPRHYPRNALVERHRLLCWVANLPAYGLRVLRTGSHVGPSVPKAIRARATRNGIANGHYGVHIADGCVVIAAGDRQVIDAVGVESRGERGDLYTPSGIDGTERHGRLVRARVTARGPLRAELSTWWRVPVAERSLESAAGEPMTHRAATEVVRVRLQLHAAAAWVRILIDGDWQSPDARLRLWVRTGLPGARTWADASFGDVERAPIAASEDDQRAEHVQSTAPLHRFVSRYTETAGATLFSDGLAEYEATPDGSVAVTLLRAVGELSRGNLPERAGHAGWPVSTPDAQSLGPFEATFALALHGPRSPDTVAKVHAMADDVLLPIVGDTWRSAIDPPEGWTGATLEGKGLVCSAIKPSEDREWTVLRCVNVTDEWVAGSWRFATIREASMARLDERRTGALPVTAGVVEFVAPPRAVVTVLAR